MAVRNRRVATVFVTMTLVLTGCSATINGHPQADARLTPPGSSGSSTPQAPSGTVTFGESTEFPSNLMPLISAGNSQAVGNLTVRVLDGLYRSSPDVTYTPDPDQGTATSTIESGRQVIDIRINPEAVWADGEPITSDDYIFTAKVQRSIDPKRGGCAALLSTGGFQSVERFERIDDKRVRLHLAAGQTDPDWKGLYSSSPALLPKHVVDKGSPTATCAYITKGWPVAGGIPLGAQNGPWLLEGKNVDMSERTVTLVPNPRYWGPKPRLAKLVYRTVSGDADTTVRALSSDGVDIVYPQPQFDLLSRLRQLSGVKTEISFGSSFEHLDFNTTDGLLKYRQIRQAIALAADRRALVDETVGRFSDRAQPLGNRLLLNNQRGYVDNAGKYNSQNIAKAKQLIEIVGGKLGSDGIYRIGGRKLAFRVMTTQNNPLRDATIKVLARQVKPAGVELTEFANPDIFEGPDKPTSLASHGFQIALFAWVGSPSISSSNPIYGRPATYGVSGLNYTQGGTAEIDAALSRIVASMTPAGEIAATNEADRLLWDQMYTMPLYQKPTLLAYRDNISGLRDNATLAGPLWNSDQFSVR